MSDNKTHYRKVFKSDHLGSADIEEMIEENKSLMFTIKNVTQHVMTSVNGSGVTVAGKRISANIAHFVEDIKPLVLNATNSKRVAIITGSKFVDDWSGALIELYIDSSVKMKGETVGGVRIKASTQLTESYLLGLLQEKENLVPETEIAGLDAFIRSGDKAKQKRAYTYLKSK